MSTDVKATWLHLDEKKNALDYLEMGVRSLVEAERQPIAWKWVCIALHGALYGFGVCAIQGTNFELVLERDKEGNVTDKLLSFRNVIKRCKTEEVVGRGVISKPLVLTKTQENAIERMQKEFRNPLEHFVPKGWSIEIQLFPEIAISYFEIIEFLAGDSGNLRWNDDEIARIKVLCNSGKELASKIGR